jgi:poly(3-hydroxybutyrate) depolymerase
VRAANADDIVKQWTNVHGIESAPAEDVVDGYPRQVWRSGGGDVVESYTITGMAHARHGIQVNEEALRERPIGINATSRNPIDFALIRVVTIKNVQKQL